jgi:hypothetical protein
MCLTGVPPPKPPRPPPKPALNLQPPNNGGNYDIHPAKNLTRPKGL